MNRRQFIKRAAMAATAVAVAPMAVLKAEEFATGGIVAPLNPPIIVGEIVRDCGRISAGYYSIKWPVTARKWEQGTYVDDGLMEYK